MVACLEALKGSERWTPGEGTCRGESWPGTGHARVSFYLLLPAVRLGHACGLCICQARRQFLRIPSARGQPVLGVLIPHKCEFLAGWPCSVGSGLPAS